MWEDEFVRTWIHLTSFEVLSKSLVEESREACVVLLARNRNTVRSLDFYAKSKTVTFSGEVV